MSGLCWCERCSKPHYSMCVQSTAKDQSPQHCRSTSHGGSSECIMALNDLCPARVVSNNTAPSSRRHLRYLALLWQQSQQLHQLSMASLSCRCKRCCSVLLVPCAVWVLLGLVTQHDRHTHCCAWSYSALQVHICTPQQQPRHDCFVTTCCSTRERRHARL